MYNDELYDQSEDLYRKILIAYIGDYLCPPDDERYPATPGYQLTSTVGTASDY
ncbi:MAG: hypothetical protein M1456_01670 [Actinobacteria bacterium]|nr:hypothetical protein [Actinomycetota bacterium]